MKYQAGEGELGQIYRSLEARLQVLNLPRAKHSARYQQQFLSKFFLNELKKKNLDQEPLLLIILCSSQKQPDQTGSFVKQANSQGERTLLAYAGYTHLNSVGLSEAGTVSCPSFKLIEQLFTESLLYIRHFARDFRESQGSISAYKTPTVQQGPRVRNMSN